MVVGAPLVPCIINPLVVALTLVARLSVGIVGGSLVPCSVSSSTVSAVESNVVLVCLAVSVVVALVSLSAVVLVINTICFSLEVISHDIAMPSLNGYKTSAKKNSFEHIKIDFFLL